MQKSETIMLSIDPSTTSTGLALFINGKLTEYCHFCPIPEYEINDRVSQTIIWLSSWFEAYHPDICIVEGLTVFNDIKTDTALSDIIGALKGLALANHCFFDRLFPAEWRKLIANDDEKIPTKREDCKPWDIKKVWEWNHVKTDSDDMADAILIGQAYINLFGNDSDAIEISYEKSAFEQINQRGCKCEIIHHNG